MGKVDPVVRIGYSQATELIMPATLPAPEQTVKAYKSLSNEELQRRINDVRAEMGSRLLILGHHYQQDEVIQLSDLQGDSFS